MANDGNSWRRNERFRRWPERTKGEFPEIPYPKDTRFTIKQIAYLHAWCGVEVQDLVSRYPRTLNPFLVHLALAHYYSDKEKIDEQIKVDVTFDRRKNLDEHTMTLPSLRDAAFIDAAKVEK